MNLLVFHIVGGQAFFSGIALLLVAAAASIRSTARSKRITILAFLIGLLAVTLSSTAISYWWYALAAVATIAWILSIGLRKWRRSSTAAFAAVWSIAALLEVPYLLLPVPAPTSSRSVAIIGDSVTAGVGGDEKSETWPKLLAREHDLQVQDVSHMGDTAASALKRIRTRTVSAPIVVVEIGGNDLLGSTTSSQFAHDLDALLGYLATPDRQVLMFELPLPPFCHEYGRIQCALARRHGVLLIPKRVFLSVVAGGDATLDSIHLSQAGHRLMAEQVWRLLEPAFSAMPSK